MANIVRGGRGSNQYVIKAPTQVAQEAEELRARTAMYGFHPAESRSSYEIYSKMGEDQARLYHALFNSEASDKDMEANRQLIAQYQDALIEQQPNALGLAAIAASRQSAQSAAMGVENPYKEQCEMIERALMGESYDEEDMVHAIADLTGLDLSSGASDLGHGVPLYAALANSSQLPVRDRIEKLAEVREYMSRQTAQHILS